MATGYHVSVDELVLQTFGVPKEGCRWTLDTLDTHGCACHVGVDIREVRFSDGVVMEVAAIRFVVTRKDRRRQGLATYLMQSAHDMACAYPLSFAVVFTDVSAGFFEKLGYEMVRPGALVYQLKDQPWPEMAWETVGPEW